MKFSYITLFFFFLVGCFAPSSKPASLRIAFNSYPVTLDPRKSGDFTSASLIGLLYEGLTRCGPNEEIIPAAAYKIDISPDGKLYTFHLRKTYWTDGKPVTALDFEKSWKKSIDPSFPCLSTYLFSSIKNVENYIQGKLSLKEVGIQALDPYTLQVELERPTPYFLSLTAFPIYLPIPNHREERGDKNDPGHLVCNGPFRIEKMVPNNEILLRKNKQFWNKKEISLDSIHISIVADETTGLQMFERGDLDFIGGPLSPLPPDSLKYLSNQGSLHFIPMDASTFCAFNNQTFPFHNISLRKAFSYALERKTILEETLQTGQTPAITPLPPSLFPSSLQDQYPIIKTNLQEAKNLFQKALKELNISASDLNQMTLYYKPGKDNQRLAQTLQKNWEKVLGVTLKIEQLDQKSHLEKLHNHDYQIALASWICQFHDPISLLDRFRYAENPKNYSGWENDDYISLLEQASLCSNRLERYMILKKAEEIFINEMPIIPLYHWRSPYISHKKIKKIATTASGGILFEQFQINDPLPIHLMK